MQPNRIINYLPDKALFIPQLAMSKVMAADGSRIYASSDHMFRGAVFGRDSLEVAEDLMDIKPKLVENILICMAELQGTTTDTIREEEPGKIIHEYRSTKLQGTQLDAASLKIFRELGSIWGGTDQELAYYGSIDATPLFLRVLGIFCSKHGDSILDKSVLQRDGSNITIRQAAEKSAEWILNKLSESGSGQLEWRRTNPHGSLSQGLAYDALVEAARLFTDKSSDYMKRARQLQTDTFNLLWQPDRDYFALGTDYDGANNLRIIKTKSANAAELLDSSIFDTLPEKRREIYITSIVKTITSEDFWTDAGIRSRALCERHLVKIWDYHGSYVTWPKETHDIARGLRRQGLPKLARQLENRLLNLVLRTYDYPEFVYVDERGRVLTGAPKKSRRKHGEIIDIGGVDKPERLQAWTVSAIWSIVAHRRSRRKEHEPRYWESALEAAILSKVKHMDRLINPIRLLRYYPSYPYFAPNLKDKYRPV
jgi:glycogen debranching enzyme